MIVYMLLNVLLHIYADARIVLILVNGVVKKKLLIIVIQNASSIEVQNVLCFYISLMYVITVNLKILAPRTDMFIQPKMLTPTPLLSVPALGLGQNSQMRN